MVVEHPAWLWVALLAVPSVLLARRWFVAMGAVRRTASAVVRTALVVALAGLLAGVQTVRRSDALAVVVVADVSGSVRRYAPDVALESGDRLGPIDAVERFIERAHAARGPDDLLGVVVFDGEAAAVATPSASDPTGRPIDVRLREGSDLAGALRLASSMIPAEAAGRVVVISDGVQTSGDAIAQAEELATGGLGSASRVPVDVVPIRYDVTGEVLVQSVDAPPAAAGRSTVTVRVLLSATGPASGRLALTRNGDPVDADPDGPTLTRAVQLREGLNVVLVDVPLPPDRVHRFVAEFEPDAGDRIAENNTGEAFTITPGQGAVLLLDGRGAESSANPLAEALQAEGFELERRPATASPGSLLDLEAYDLVILQNVPAEAVPERTQRDLAAYVRDLGGGLVMVGGPDSFGAGGWNGTPIEEVLPLELDLPEELVMPDAAVVFCIDASGSMNRRVFGSSRTQQDIAGEATALAIRTLEDDDLVGVTSFSAGASRVVELGPNDDKDRTSQRVQSMASGGGTNIPAALDDALEQLEQTDAQLKHVILLSDGRSMNAEALPGLADRMRSADIGITVVAVGDDSRVDTRAMRALADRAGGKYYHVFNPTLLPQVFVKAVRVVRQPLIRERTFVPVVLPTGSPLTGGMGTTPALGGFVLTQPREEPLVTHAMATPEGEPVLSHWSVELGRVAAFTSDADVWAEGWLGWAGYQRFWAQVARGTARGPQPRGYELTTSRQGDTLRLTLDATDADGTPELGLRVPATVYAPDGTAREVMLDAVGPGVYRAELAAPEPGLHVALAKPQRGGVRLTPTIAGRIVHAGAEHRTLRSDERTLEELAARTGGRVIERDTADVSLLFDRAQVEPRLAYQPLWPVLLPWFVVLLLLDIGVRRLAWDRLLAPELRADVAEASRARRLEKAAASARTLGGLRTQRSEPREEAAPGPAALSQDDAIKLMRAQRQERARRKMEQARKAQEAAGSAAVQQPPDSAAPLTGASEPTEAPSSSLLDAKRRARERFQEDEE